MTVAGTRRFQGIRPQSLYIYIRTSLRGQFMYLTVSMRLRILAVACIGSAERNALPTDCCRISSLRLTMCCCPTRETLILSGGFRNRRRCELHQHVLRCSQLLRSDLRPPQLRRAAAGVGRNGPTRNRTLERSLNSGTLDKGKTTANRSHRQNRFGPFISEWLDKRISA
jgi:hypothetical protein